MSTSSRGSVGVSTPPPGLRRVGVRQPIGEYLRDVWGHREFAREIAVGNLRAQNMDTVLGSAWHLMNPIFLVGVYYLLFGVILDTSRGVDNFITFLAVGVFVYHYTQRAVMSGAKSVANNEGLIRSIKFPRAVLPISAVFEEGFAFLSAMGVLVAVALATGEPARSSWVLIPAVLVLQTIFNLGGSFVAARLAERFRDVVNILPYLFRLAFYLSGALYPVSLFIDDPVQQRLFNLNPMYSLITLMREPILGVEAGHFVWMSAVGWSVVLFVGGLLFFRAGETRYGRS